MGWFWSDTPATPSTRSAPHPMPKDSSAAPPPGCPMHKSPNVTSTPSTAPFASLAASSNDSAPSGGCPVKHDTPASSSSSSASIFGKLNPLNYMPSSISQAPAPNQTLSLPTSREASSIPRGDASDNWEYPSPQQMYNAMLRKGHEDTPIDAVESMVAVHNFLNEGAWAEIEGWEARFSRGLGFGWRTCRRGEEGFAEEYTKAKAEQDWSDMPAPKLNRFMGRPGELTPRARMFQMAGTVVPSMRGEPPFDRHDWFVQRRMPDGNSHEVRYVIDYYSGEPEPTGEPVFFLDVRPALDSPTQAVQRMMRWGGDVWYRGSGVAVREAKAAAAASKQ